MPVKTSAQEKEKYTIVTGHLFLHDLDTAARYTNEIFLNGEYRIMAWKNAKKMYG